MSLDVYLRFPGRENEPRRAIFVRQDGQTQEITRAQWDEMNLDREPTLIEVGGTDCAVYSANITHNLNEMADQAGIYKHLWRPEEVDVKFARGLIGPLSEGLARLVNDPEGFRKFNPKNGWGSYETLVQFVADYLEACKAAPDAQVTVSR